MTIKLPPSTSSPWTAPFSSLHQSRPDPRPFSPSQGQLGSWITSGVRCPGWVGPAGLTPVLFPPSPAEPPKQVMLKLQPTRVAVGTSFTIECRVAAVEPLESLTLTVFRGQETVHNQTFVGAAPVPLEAATTVISTAPQGSGPLNFSCQAELDLRSRGGDLIRSISEPQVLQVYGNQIPGRGWVPLAFGPLVRRKKPECYSQAS